MVIVAVIIAVYLVFEVISFVAVGSLLITSCYRLLNRCFTGHTSVVIPAELQIAVANDLVKVGSELIVGDSDDIVAGEGLFYLPTDATKFPIGTRFKVCGIGRDRFSVEAINVAEQVAASDR